MKKSYNIILALFIALLLLSCEKEEKNTYQQINNRILELVNIEREKDGLAKMEMYDFLNKEASQHTEYMISQNRISHDGFNERAARIQTELGANQVGENVAYGQTSAENVMQTWMNSDGHRANILGDYNIIGISAMSDDSNQYFYTQIFAKIP